MIKWLIPDEIKEIKGKYAHILKSNYFALAGHCAEDCPKLLISRGEQAKAFKGRKKKEILAELIRPCQEDCFVNICSPTGCSVDLGKEVIGFFEEVLRNWHVKKNKAKMVNTHV